MRRVKLTLNRAGVVPYKCLGKGKKPCPKGARMIGVFSMGSTLRPMCSECGRNKTPIGVV